MYSFHQYTKLLLFILYFKKGRNLFKFKEKEFKKGNMKPGKQSSVQN